MRNILFIAPFPLQTTYAFVRAVARLQDVRMLGIVTKPPTGRDEGIFNDMVTVRNPLDAHTLIDAARLLQRRHGSNDRVLGILEPLQVQIAQVREALGLDTGFTHMEWFRRDDGSLAIGEIAARLPGAQIVAGNNYVPDADLYRAWARAVVDGEFDGPFERKYAVVVAFLRGVGHGLILGSQGGHEAHEANGPLVVESRLPQPGAPRADSDEGDGFVIVRDPDVEVVKAALKTIVGHIRIHYAGRR